MILNQDTIARPELHEQVSPVSLFKAAVLQSDIGGPPTDTHTHTLSKQIRLQVILFMI